MQRGLALMLAAFVAAAQFNGGAVAQQGVAPGQNQPPAHDHGAAPSNAGPGQNAQQERRGRDMNMPGRGMRQGMEGRGMGMRPAMANLSDADRQAFFEARLAAIKAGLMLTESQQGLWPALETAMRDMRKLRLDAAERFRKEGQPANPADRLKRAGEMLSARGAALTKLADAMKPIHDSLSDDQKRRMHMLMRGGGMRQGAGPGFMPGRGQRPPMGSEFQPRRF